MAEGKQLFVGLIPDGGRRAVDYDLGQYPASYESGGEVVGDMLKLCIQDERVRIFAAWGLSDDNARKRSPVEIGILNGIFTKFLSHLRRDLATDLYKDVKVVHMGNPALVDQGVMSLVSDITTSTRGRGKKLFGLCLGYGPKDELLRAENISYGRRQRGEKVNILDCLDLPYRGNMPYTSADIILRTGTDPLTPYMSGYLVPYQVEGVTQEKYFSEFLPQCDPHIVLEAIDDYEQRVLRKGQ